MKTLTLVAVFVLGLLGLPAAASYAADPGVLVQWPTETKLNPTTTTYDFTVDDQATDPAAEGTLYAEWLGQRTEILHQGAVSLTLQSDGTSQVHILRCLADASCAEVAVSPALEARSSLSVALLTQTVGPRRAQISLSTAPTADVSGTVDWTLATDTSTPAEVSSGQSTFSTGSGTTASFPIHVPEGTPSGDYVARVTLNADATPFGPLPGMASRVIGVDSEAVATISATSSHLYPVRDDYHDTAVIRLDVGEMIVHPRIEAFAEDGSSADVVLDMPSTRMDQAKVWDGRPSGHALADGTYTLRLTGRDNMRNPLDSSITVSVSGKRLTWVTWKRTFPAASTISDRWVGSCSQLKSPSSHGWAGSLGYYSQTSCTAPRQSPVLTVNGVYVPRSFLGSYGDFRVTVHGGAARGEDSAYAVLGYLRAGDGGFSKRAQLTGRMGDHVGHVADGDQFVRDKHEKHPFAIWQLGLSEGSRYDVKNFTVELDHRVLR